MKITKFTESQIVKILKSSEQGVPVTDICREQGISNSTFYKWRSKYGGMDVSMLTKIKELEAQNNRLKRMYADLQLDHDILKEVMQKKF
jgi:putative transposase|tara:strand:- start:530 stop:796 length:267 start_codon:yes stop_codon:yes gene_type:complete